MKRAALLPCILLAIFSTFVAVSAQTLPINYQLQLQVRAANGGTAFNLPNGSTFNSASVNLNNLGEIAIRVNTIGLTVTPGLFVGGHGTGTLVHNPSDSAALFGDAFINNNNQVTFTRFSSTNAADDGVWLYNEATGMTTKATNGPLGATSYSNPVMNDIGIIGTRIKFNTPQALFSFNPATNAFINYVTETSGDPNSPYSFIYSPAFNNNNRLAAEVNLGAQASTFKELRVWNPNGSSTLVAAGDSGTGPTYFGFDNSISMNNNDQVAFISRTDSSASTNRRIVVSDGTTTTLFPKVSAGAGFTSLDSFAPVVNDNGLVAFRGNDTNGRDSVFVSNGTTVQRIAGVGDIVPTDLGPREIGFLMGGIDINILGAVAFGVQYTSASGGGGNAAYVAYVKIVPLGAVSRKTHGGEGIFDIPLPLTGTPGVECRQGTGVNSDTHQVVVTFGAPVTLSSAAVTSGNGVVNSAVATDNQIVINLSQVTDAQRLSITLSNVYDGANTSDVVIPMNVLIGDVNGSGGVTSTDIAQTKAAAGTLSATTFRADLNANGAINTTDIAIVKAKAGNTLP